MASGGRQCQFFIVATFARSASRHYILLWIVVVVVHGGLVGLQDLQKSGLDKLCCHFIGIFLWGGIIFCTIVAFIVVTDMISKSDNHFLFGQGNGRHGTSTRIIGSIGQFLCFLKTRSRRTQMLKQLIARRKRLHRTKLTLMCALLGSSLR